ncbi:hypothetical protein QQF64_025626 [Cirrhinus molitorella]|uniref:Uncharacterized protein n=1 Tax=Cirrhinus molitorella TaxID=172907 RepID=A0ABR3NPK8_9TELE
MSRRNKNTVNDKHEGRDYRAAGLFVVTVADRPDCAMIRQDSGVLSRYFSHWFVVFQRRSAILLCFSSAFSARERKRRAAAACRPEEKPQRISHILKIK